MEHYEKLDDEARQDADKARVLWKDLWKRVLFLDDG
jgi:hypothetical protein